MSDGHPTQPLVFDDHGVIRFKRNEAVRYLLDNGGIDLTQLYLLVGNGTIPVDDYMHLMQLIGYSVSGYGDLAYGDGDERTAWQQHADEMDARAERMLAEKKREAGQ